MTNPLEQETVWTRVGDKKNQSEELGGTVGEGGSERQPVLGRAPHFPGGVLRVPLRCCLGPEWAVGEKWFRGERTELAGSEAQREPSHPGRTRLWGPCLCHSQKQEPGYSEEGDIPRD